MAQAELLADDYKVNLDVFEGPLDLLLYLIRREELDIYDIPIEHITKQYMAYLDIMRQLNLDVAGEFIVMAATLMVIKSRMLLPVDRRATEEGVEEEWVDPRLDLVRQLVEYKKFKDAAGKLARSEEAGLAAEKAVMTTDTKPKQAAVQTKIGGKTVTVGGMCKGSGMIEPNMATMLGFITTDAAVTPAMLRRALKLAIAVSFNHVVVDGDESTNDSVFLLASGAAGNAVIDKAGADFDAFVEALTAVGVALAKQMAADGEGATKYVEVRVKNAKTQRDADRAARAIAKSPLAKTSWFGKDPNWGRVLAAAGYSGAQVVDMEAEVFYGKTWAYRKGRVADAAQLAKLEKEMQGPELVVTVDLHLGTYESTIFTCDFSLDYVHINADYTT